MKPRILFVTPEIAPLVKTGGLADVSGALPAALCAQGLDVRVLVPGYPALLDQLRLRRAAPALELLPGLDPATLLQGRIPDTGVPIYVLRQRALYERDGGPYLDPRGEDWPDNDLRFAALGRAAALLAGDAPLRWRPALVHANDWQGGLAPAYLRLSGSPARCCFSVHNLAFTGSFPAERVDALALPRAGFQMHGFEFYGQVSFLKAGLYYADRIVTVSPSYAEEIRTTELGGGLRGLLAARAGDLVGIVNGIDTALWDPRTDPHLERHYSERSLAGKALNKAALQRRLGLDAEPDTPLVGMVTRLTEQKGVDLALAALAALAGQRWQLAVLGSGDARLESAIREIAAAMPGRIGFARGFDEPLAHLVEAGADLFLMPSRFEPCGLNQMYSMRYGTPPVVRRTGGLADTVIDADGARDATGFVFEEPRPEALAAALERAFARYRDRSAWRRIQRAGMRGDYSWAASARRYADLYEALLGG